MDDIADDLLPQRSLVCAIVAQAVRDCSKPMSKEGKEAVRWLGSREVEEWCLGWNLDIGKVRQVVNRTESN